MPFLAIDVGNTRLKWTLYDRPTLGARVLARGVEFLEQIEHLAETTWARLPTPTYMLGCTVAARSVKQQVEEQMEIWDIESHWVVPDEAEAGIINGYDTPSRLGADRWVAMIGARHHVLQAGPARPILLVMVGTAVTVEAIDADGRFLGGLILPGHGLMLHALEAGTAGLHVPTGDVRDFPTDTSDALTSGGTYAIAGACELMARNLERRCGAAPVCLMTGGAGWKMMPFMSRPFELLENLIFDGLLVLASTRVAATSGSDGGR
jgi:type III pantothenate kinase